MIFRQSLFCLCLAFTIIGNVFAEPQPLVIDKSQKKERDEYIKKAHDVIPHQLSLEKVRYVILQATLSNKQIPWLLEEEGEDYFIVRWDYSRRSIIARIEYNKSLIQLKYVGSHDGFKCKNNIDGICYKNEKKKYYSYMSRLRNTILDQLKHQQN